jgi:hypothetical protein
MKHTTIAIALLAAGTAVAAQERGTSQAVAPAPFPAQQVAQTLPRMTVEGRITTGAPYSGEAVTDSLQVLSDGTRIVKKTTTRVYRDSQGRTRREQIVNGDVVSVSISDPVAESTYVLDPRTKMAYRNGVIVGFARGQASGSVTPGSDGVVVATKMPDGSTKVEAGSPMPGTRGGSMFDPSEARPRTPGDGGDAPVSVAVGGARGRGGRGGGAGATAGGGVGDPNAAEVFYPVNGGPGSKGTTEDLGQQMIDGVLATGTRTTIVIPTGAIGNDQPIQVLSEQWFSSELQVLVMTKHSDPRSGVTSYNLTNVVRAEQPHSLFEVPADYTLKDSVIRRQSPSMQ